MPGPIGSRSYRSPRSGGLGLLLCILLAPTVGTLAADAPITAAHSARTSCTDDGAGPACPAQNSSVEAPSRSVNLGPAGDHVIQSAATGARLTIAPPTGKFASTQSFDLGVLLEASPFKLVGGRARFDGADVTGLIAGCNSIRLGSLRPDGVSLRCPGLSAAELGVGYHYLEVELYFSDGSILRDEATWAVIEGRE